MLRSYRAVRNIQLGNYSYCSDGTMPCGAYEGHCRRDNDCQFNTMCAIGAGAKYGLPEGSNVCIPQYGIKTSNHLSGHQIAFLPTMLYKAQPTSVLFYERGQPEIPRRAKVRVLEGSNPGCMGVWDQSVPVAAEATLLKHGRHRVRPEGRPVAGGSWAHLDQDLPYHTQPYLLWEGLTLEGRSVLEASTFRDTRYQVCLCDADADCTHPPAWSDLGFLSLEPAASYYVSAREHAGQHLSHGAIVGVGGELFESYREADMAHYWPKLQRLRASDSEPLHNELCAQRCSANPLCLGFDMVDPEWSGGRSHTCAARPSRSRAGARLQAARAPRPPSRATPPPPRTPRPRASHVPTLPRPPAGATCAATACSFACSPVGTSATRRQTST